LNDRKPRYCRPATRGTPLPAWAWCTLAFYRRAATAADRDEASPSATPFEEFCFLISFGVLRFRFEAVDLVGLFEQIQRQLAQVLFILGAFYVRDNPEQSMEVSGSRQRCQ
jgi:hypothetical protein